MRPSMNDCPALGENQGESEEHADYLGMPTLGEQAGLCHERECSSI